MDSTGYSNLTLGRLGVGQAIAALTDRTVAAQTCSRFFDFCRQDVLRAFPWGFATRALPLAQIADTTFPGWGYVYASPAKCLMVRAVGDAYGLRGVSSAFACGDAGAGAQLRQARQPFQLALADDGARQVILSDLADAWAFITVDVPNTGAWPVDFGSIFSWRLGMEVGGPMQAKQEMIDRCEQRYGTWFSQAAASSMNEQRDDTRGDSPSISCRA